MLRVTVEHLHDDGTAAPVPVYQLLIRRRDVAVDPADAQAVDVRLSRRGIPFTVDALCGDDQALRRETDTLGVLVSHRARHPLLTTYDALRVLLQRLKYGAPS